MYPQTQQTHQPMDFMLSCSHKVHIHFRKTQTIDGKIITAGELVVKVQYICSMKIDTK